MQKFVNNWQAPIELAQGVTELSIELPDGSYRITCADAAGGSATRWEIVGAEVSGGTATLTRGMEGTTEQDWPEGSIAYISITAGFLEALQLQIADLTDRVAALEGGGGPVPDGALTDSLGRTLIDSAGKILKTGAIA